jgi:hypothetical protein
MVRPEAPHPSPLPEGEGAKGPARGTVTLHICRCKRPASRGGNCGTMLPIATRPGRMPGGSAMKIFAFNLLLYAEHLDHLKEGRELPWPLPKRHFRPEVAARTYEKHLEA